MQLRQGFTELPLMPIQKSIRTTGQPIGLIMKQPVRYVLARSWSKVATTIS